MLSNRSTRWRGNWFSLYRARCVVVQVYSWGSNSWGTKKLPCVSWYRIKARNCSSQLRFQENPRTLSIHWMRSSVMDEDSSPSWKRRYSSCCSAIHLPMEPRAWQWPLLRRNSTNRMNFPRQSCFSKSSSSSSSSFSNESSSSSSSSKSSSSTSNSSSSSSTTSISSSSSSSSTTCWPMLLLLLSLSLLWLNAILGFGFP
mmetsp:Transcript_1376/g.2975  ORF Transcript_1376/g.2975 Transcript_1376/m.2975 type:complete len:200 (+) Transcript_1376:683-1282(+)